MSDLRERVPGHALIDELLHQWDLGTIHVDERSNGIVIDEEAEGWYRGVLGERRVAAILDQLRDGWTVLHSVPVGRGASDIDHVVVGPPGVFTINTKFSPGRTVWVAGRNMNVEGVKKPYILNSLAEAQRASNLLTARCGLTVPVTGVIVFVNPGRMTVKEPPGGGEMDPPIQVVDDQGLLDVLFRRREFSDEQIARIVDAAIRPDTWSDSTTPSSLGTHVAREFQALEQEVGPRLSLPRGVARSVAPRAYSGRSYPRGSSAPRRQYSGPRPSPRKKASLLEQFLVAVFGMGALMLLALVGLPWFMRLLTEALLP